MNELNELKRNHECMYFDGRMFSVRCHHHTGTRSPLRIKILPLLDAESNIRQLAIFVYFCYLLNLPPQPELISISYGGTMVSSALLPHTHCGIARLRFHVTVWTESVVSHIGSNFEIWYLRQGLAMPKLVMLV